MLTFAHVAGAGVSSSRHEGRVTPVPLSIATAVAVSASALRAATRQMDVMQRHLQTDMAGVQPACANFRSCFTYPGM
jgi:hypothetical protein